ncbi:hypothetical protein [Evansella halocellulosilytica]|uniref:hypothetical protein n=1 Tax=Evansella halocellulosilytica TaxID=2011013 RepID=UPI000BB9400E|nr:hypothetical protein [Evansella halocellulosilytica]
MNQSIQQLTTWLENNKQHTLQISKQERSTGKLEMIDEDQIQLFLQGISVRKIERHDRDDYLADQELILQGDGQIQSERGYVALPQSVFEIPLIGDISITEQQNSMIIDTEKAIYEIKIQ